MKEYIERDAAIFDLEIYEKQVVKDEYALAIAGCRSHIRNIPAADVVEVRHGEWIEENTRPRSSQFYCSVCRRTAYDPQPTRLKGWKKRCHYAYCPNCGAKMDGGVGND